MFLSAAKKRCPRHDLPRGASIAQRGAAGSGPGRPPQRTGGGFHPTTVSGPRPRDGPGKGRGSPGIARQGGPGGGPRGTPPRERGEIWPPPSGWPLSPPSGGLAPLRKSPENKHFFGSPGPSPIRPPKMAPRTVWGVGGTGGKKPPFLGPPKNVIFSCFWTPIFTPNSQVRFCAHFWHRI